MRAASRLVSDLTWRQPKTPARRAVLHGGPTSPPQEVATETGLAILSVTRDRDIDIHVIDPEIRDEEAM